MYIQFSSVILSFSIHLKEENNKIPAISLSRIHFDESWTKINEIAWKWLDIKWVRESELLFIWYGVARFLYYLVFLSSAKAIYHFDENSSLNGLTPSTKSFFSFFLSFSFSRSVFGINEWLLIDCIDIQSDRKAISNEISMHIPTHTHSHLTLCWLDYLAKLFYKNQTQIKTIISVWGSCESYLQSNSCEQC